MEVDSALCANTKNLIGTSKTGNLVRIDEQSEKINRENEQRVANIKRYSKYDLNIESACDSRLVEGVIKFLNII